MCSLIRENSESPLDHDELMLKELERRDGIYSFIFHELEAPRENFIKEENKILPPTSPTVNRQTFAFNESSELPIQSPSVHLPALSTSNNSDHLPDVTNVFQTPTITLPTVRQSNEENSLQKMPSFGAPKLTMCNNHYLKAWRPASSLFYDCTKICNYVSNRTFRVRIPMPRFSHISAPLIRNRRHALKETADYKNCKMCTIGVPDLRSLFPNDPDVHAPFNKLSNMHEKSGGVITPTILIDQQQ
ncbi:uncharacterized protein LOC119644573 [Glossina fuscipes]|uniref:Uncharacterized protein LOC119644573 n=1 Tax=Glossina fuscipes TaxID=7396 RepID=A0A9C5ZN18_9MUSC|nr:uncharacterized protein LOC119644573 [Glossina fuscipes]KAI9590222.1 hypothetical protein GQX74_008390 [Glossina fuscipes]